MKTILSIVSAILASTPLLRAQTVQTVAFPLSNSSEYRRQDINVPTGQVFKLLTWAAAAMGSTIPSGIKVDDASVNLSSFVKDNYGGLTPIPTVLSPNFVVAGPRTVSFGVNPDQSLVCSYILETNGTVATQNAASQVVVIPQNGSAPADVILESSTDLVSWTAAAPGSYPTSTANRFFRVRLVLH